MKGGRAFRPGHLRNGRGTLHLLYGEDVKKVYACGTLMGFYNVEKLDSDNLQEQVAEKLGYDPEDIRVMDTV